jgi:hypothetical protein
MMAKLEINMANINNHQPLLIPVQVSPFTPDPDPFKLVSLVLLDSRSEFIDPRSIWFIFPNSETEISSNDYEDDHDGELESDTGQHEVTGCVGWGFDGSCPSSSYCLEDEGNDIGSEEDGHKLDISYCRGLHTGSETDLAGCEHAVCGVDPFDGFP